MEENIFEKEDEKYEKMAFPIISNESKANEILTDILNNKKEVKYAIMS